MASALSPPKGPKPKGVPPSHYYESFLEKKGPCDQVESLESREMWKGFILTVVELHVPSNLTLLPGHLYMMAEVLDKEKARRAAEVPWCFLQVSRLEAQLLLERYPECGNLLLRPGGDGKDGVSVTTRQILNGSPVVKHYKVKREGPMYVIDVEDPFSCPSLDAVVNYFVTYTKRALVPFLMEEDYEKVLGFVDSDRENGESVWAVSSSRDSGPAPLANVSKPLPPVPVPVSVSSQEDRLPLLPPLPQLPDQDENYVTPIEDSPAVEYVNQDVSSSSHPVPSKPKKPVKLPAKPPKPPIMPKPDLKAITSVWARKPVSPQDPFLLTKLGDVTAELEEKLQKRRALEHSSRPPGTSGLSQDTTVLHQLCPH
ncbi:signal-transducing adaptor protein 2 isoform X2 [Microtus pennsylvanicus]|uniref:signal-transducing adaptor protein 2 isoform X2 n=1 Tax=Microtus pennsylvanicus TaxID=10058 RepID=UPI003F6C6E23